VFIGTELRLVRFLNNNLDQLSYVCYCLMGLSLALNLAILVSNLTAIHIIFTDLNIVKMIEIALWSLLNEADRFHEVELTAEEGIYKKVNFSRHRKVKAHFAEVKVSIRGRFL